MAVPVGEAFPDWRGGAGSTSSWPGRFNGCCSIGADSFWYDAGSGTGPPAQQLGVAAAHLTRCRA